MRSRGIFDHPHDFAIKPFLDPISEDSLGDLELRFSRDFFADYSYSLLGYANNHVIDESLLRQSLDWGDAW